MKSIYEFLLGEHLLNEHLLKSKTTISTQDTDYVDLGLPSRLLWAMCNIGANDPTEYGDYFMWGNTEPNTNDDCDWGHAPFNDGHIEFNKRYFDQVQNKVCHNGILAPEYDAVTIILGHEWRLPTMNDFNELIDNTKHEWVENYQDSKIDGMIFEANGTELFIPAAGCRNKTRFYDKGSCVYMWSSSLNTSGSYSYSKYYAKYLYLDHSSYSVNNSSRQYGFCLRGVKNK